MLELKPCANPQCNDEFFPASNTQRYCSRACRDRAYYNRPLRREPIKCVVCGKEFMPKATTQRYCSTTCSVAAEKKRHRSNPYVPKPKAEPKPKPVKSDKPLEQWVREATACNMDYGNYRALIEHCGKTFEELKATADTRHLPAHSSIKRKRSD